jgi:pimeloyl-ACP methyl ester carboxylesterase
VSNDRDLTAVTHAMADIEPGLRLHFVTAGQGARTIVLLHGFPQTWWQWHRIIPALVAGGFRVVAPDYRGAGHSWRPPGGYDKQTMAEDIHQLLRQRLGIQGPVVLVGHDIGLMVAYAYAQAYRDEVSRLVVVDAPLPGTAVFDRLRTDPRVWHFAFHAAHNRAVLRRHGKLTIPVLAMGGAISTSGPLVEEMMREVAEHVTGVRVPGTAHWIAEENPRAFASAVLEFVGTAESD